jgi:large subunit ribosomal protein L6
MSRIGKRPVELPRGVSASVSGQTIEVKGPKGTRSFTATDDVTSPSRTTPSRSSRAASPSARASSGACPAPWSQNLVTGVTDGFKKELEIQGVGYRAQVQGNTLKLSLGYSHDVDFAIPQGITVTCPKPTEIVVEGIRPATGRSGCREYPRMARAGALQGQGHPLQGRVHLPQGRQEEVRARQWQTSKRELFQKRRLRNRNKLRDGNGRRVCRCIARTRTSACSSSTTPKARRWPPPRRSKARWALSARTTWKPPPRWAPRLPSARRRPVSTECSSTAAGFLFHGRVKALADAAREGGLKF